MEGAMKSQVENAISQQRKKIIGEAVSALAETKNALRALDEKKTEEALAALERASGKLNIVLAREPKLALAPIDIGVTTYAVYATLDAIKKAKEQAEDGEVQKALSHLPADHHQLAVSRCIRIPTPLRPLRRSSIETDHDAKAAIEAALNTSVVIHHIIPLPLVSADVRWRRLRRWRKREGAPRKTTRI